MHMAYAAAIRSQATRRRVGCIAILPDLCVLEGWNGMPSGSHSEVCEDSNNITLGEVIHAEDNLLRKAFECNIFSKLEGAVIFVTDSPCRDCASKLIRAKVAAVYYDREYSCKEGIKDLINAQVIVKDQIILRRYDQEVINF